MEEHEVERARMLETPTLREFWEFATTVRRTHSLARRESAKLRGTWLTGRLAVQRVHGWGARAVRLLCVQADSEARAAKLRLFFQKDRHNMEVRLATSADPLDREPRVVVKVPYDASLAGWVEHERAVLQGLAGLEGVPELAAPIYFEDIGVPAGAHRFSGAPSLQERLEAGRLVPPEGLHRLLSFALSTLARAHERGWRHTDLHPRDILLGPGAGGGADGADGAGGGGPSLLCGWAHAVRSLDGEGPDLSQGLLELVRRLPTGVPRSPPAAASPGAPGGGREPGGPSVLSAPEQLLGLYAGVSHDCAATDVYRVAATALLAARARGPLGTASRPLEPAAARNLDTLRRLCHEALRRRAESDVPEAPPPGDETAEFARALERLLAGRLELSGCGGPELEPWFGRCLAREPRERHATAEAALEALDEAWSRLEARLLDERRAEVVSAERAEGAAVRPARQRLVLERPAELDGMEVV